MSHTPLIAPAVVSRLHELVSELDDLEVQCGFLADYAEPGLLLGLLRTLQEDVAEYSGSLSSTLDDSDGNNLVMGLGAYFVPHALGTIARQFGAAGDMLEAAGKDRPRDTRLALEWLGLRISHLGATAGFIAETVMEELPPCQPSAPQVLASVTCAPRGALRRGCGAARVRAC